MPQHTIGLTFKDDAGSVPLSGTVYTVVSEVNAAFKVAAGAVNAPFPVEFLHARINDYCISLMTQSAAQAAAATPGFSEAAAGSVTINVNSTSVPAPALTLNAKQPIAYATAIPGTTNLFTADVTEFFITNATSGDLWVLAKIGLN